jgi:hypothetical protein
LNISRKIAEISGRLFTVNFFIWEYRLSGPEDNDLFLACAPVQFMGKFLRLKKLYPLVIVSPIPSASWMVGLFTYSAADGPPYDRTPF